MYVVTGVTGNTGSVVAKRLLAAGKRVRGIGRTADHMQQLAHQGGEQFVADLTNREALTEAFTGAEGVYVMIPPNPSGPDFRAHQDAVSESLASALEHAKVSFAVTLSSIGADKMSGTGPVAGLHLMEERLNKIAGLNVLHLRAGYFMENTFAQVAPIQNLGMALGPLLPELKLSMIATRDIGAAAADALLNLNFQSHQTRELLGQRDITMSEVATIIGQVVGKPDIRYIQASDNDVRSAITQMGMTPDLAGLILQMASALNSGHMKALEARTAENTTPTSYETFAQEEFLPYYQRNKIAA